MADICGDNRFEVIARAKEHLLNSTNIYTSEDEMKVLDSFLFRCWQKGWLRQYDETATDKSMTKQEQIAYAKGYKEATDKADEWIRSQTDLDVPIPTNEKGEILTEEYIKSLEAAKDELEKVINEFKKFMEDNQ